MHDSEEDLDSHGVSLSGANTVVSRQSLPQGQLENALKIHSSNKFEEINAGQLPGPVHGARCALKQTLTLSVKSHTEITQRSLPPALGGDYCLRTSQEVFFLGSNAQQMLEAHMKKLGGLPSQVLESLEMFTWKETTTYSLLHSKLHQTT